MKLCRTLCDWQCSILACLATLRQYEFDTMALILLDHPLSAHLLTELRDKETTPDRFRHLTRQLTILLALEATKSIRAKQIDVETPLEVTQGSRIDQGLVVVPILRAGLGMLEAIASLFPDVSVGYIGLERNEKTAIASSYYCKLPSLVNKCILCVDPMLATGGSASQALSLIKAKGGADITLVSVVATPQGVAKIENDHPDVQIVSASLDRGLNEKCYIVPGLGDFGDRLYGTF